MQAHKWPRIIFKTFQFHFIHFIVSLFILYNLFSLLMLLFMYLFLWLVHNIKYDSRSFRCLHDYTMHLWLLKWQALPASDSSELHARTNVSRELSACSPLAFKPAKTIDKHHWSIYTLVTEELDHPRKGMCIGFYASISEMWDLYRFRSEVLTK
jgi:hypothetical protein